MERKAKIGLFFLAGASWWEAGVCDAKSGPYAGFIDRVKGDVASITAELAREHAVVSSGLIHTVEGAVQEARRFNEEGVEAIVFCPIIWTNDQPVLAFLQETRRVPLILWAYNPYPKMPAYYRIAEWLRASAPVSVQQSAPLLKRFGWEYSVVFGHEQDKRVLAELRAFLRAAAVKRSLKGTRIAVLPAPCRVVAATWVDEFHLLESFGVELQYLSVDRFLQLAGEVDEAAVRDYARGLREGYPNEGVDEAMLAESARFALAFVKITRDFGLSGIALEDFNEDFYRLLGFRPHLYHPDIGGMGCTIGFEADVLNVLSTIIVGRLAGRMGMFNEFFTIDPPSNTILMGHPGHGEIRVADPATLMVTPDLEFDETQKRGAWLSYRAKAGRMTFLNFTAEYGRLKAGVFRGEALGGPRLMEGYSHMLVKADAQVLRLFTRIVEDGLIQHWGTVHGDILAETRAFMRLMGQELCEYDGSPG